MSRLLSDVWWFKFYLNQALAPLNDLIAAKELDTTDYVDSLFNEGVRNGTQYWMPFARSTPLFYYNKDAFTEVGLDEPPETWDEFAEVAPQLVKKDGDTVTRSAFAHPTGASYIAWLFQGVDLGTSAAPTPTPISTSASTSRRSVAAGEFYRKSVAGRLGHYHTTRT